MNTHALIKVAVSLLAASALGLSSAATAGATPSAPDEPTPTEQAREAGVEPGNAPMGWRESAAPTLRTGSSPSSAETVAAPSGVLGIDVASYQGDLNWPDYYDAGKRFAYVKATEGTGYENPSFASQYNGSYDAGLIRGAYHFAIPSGANGATQAKYFVAHGGGWSSDGKTLPGVLDIEYNPYGSTCYGLSEAQMVSWISDFTDTYRDLTGRDAVIYSTADWWSSCTGDSGAFNDSNPLWVARYASTVGTIPGGWPYHTFWQYSSSPIDQNTFNGSTTQLKTFATG